MSRPTEIVLGTVLVVIMVLVLILFIVFLPTTRYTESDINRILEGPYERDASQMCNKEMLAKWDYLTDLTNEDKKKAYEDAVVEYAAFRRKYWNEKFRHWNPSDYSNPKVKRQVKLLKVVGDAALKESDLANLTSIKTNMFTSASRAKICPFEKQDCDLSTEGLSRRQVEQIFMESNNYDELIYAWTTWRNTTSVEMRHNFKTYVELSNKAAVANERAFCFNDESGFKDKGEQWRDQFETKNLKKIVLDLWKKVKPLYLEIHKFVSRKLKDEFKEKLDISDGLLPTHVFGTLWGQSWKGIYKIVKPFPDASKIPVNKKLTEKKFTVRQMFETANGFYTSMGLMSNEIAYNTKEGAMIEKPTDGKLADCQASSFDFCDGKNFRVKMCARVTPINLMIMHQQLGHIQYFKQYAKQPITFRKGANPGFHEAIGATVVLSAITAKHLNKIKLSDISELDHESTINSLMERALQKIAFLPLALILDLWRWDAFSGDIKENEWNTKWWKYRKEYQLVKPPIERFEAADFDPSAIFHVGSDLSYISYFVADILSFQFYKSLCIFVGQYKPEKANSTLHTCDFYGSEAAGSNLRSGLALGASKHWTKVLQEITEETELDASALLEYFKPLQEYLKSENNK